MKRYFLTVAFPTPHRQRGIFCDASGNAFSKDDAPHTEDEIWHILGPFDMVLAPESTLLDEEGVRAYCRWLPLAEYRHAYGVALTEAAFEVAS